MNEKRGWLFVLPLLVYILVLLILPLTTIFVYSFWSTEHYQFVKFWHLDNYRRIFTEYAYIKLFLRALRNAFLATFIALVVGYPIAYFLVRKLPHYNLILLLVIAAPFFVGTLIRVVSLQGVLGPLGVINLALQNLGVPRVEFLMYSNTATVIGLVYLWTPFMILAIDIGLTRVDFELLEVARAEGASLFQAFREIVFPLSWPGAAIGCMLVFIPSMAAHVTPLFLGGPNGKLYGNILWSQFADSATWGFGSALGVVLTVFSGFVVLVLLFSMRIGFAPGERA